MAPAHYVLWRRVELARVLLLVAEESLLAIAASCGFQSPTVSVILNVSPDDFGLGFGTGGRRILGKIGYIFASRRNSSIT